MKNENYRNKESISFDCFTMLINSESRLDISFYYYEVLEIKWLMPQKLLKYSFRYLCFSNQNSVFNKMSPDGLIYACSSSLCRAVQYPRLESLRTPFTKLLLRIHHGWSGFNCIDICRTKDDSLIGNCFTWTWNMQSLTIVYWFGAVDKEPVLWKQSVLTNHIQRKIKLPASAV